MITVLHRVGLANDYGILCPVVESPPPSLQPNLSWLGAFKNAYFATCVELRRNTVKFIAL